ncbi:MAG: RNA polymerase subunit sigma-70 [Ruminococcaceae bacterium]|nr:RNA polymerase subunit sigma-70 [Oscillospiraceae bacterium]
MTKQEIETLNLMRSHDKSATDIAIALGLSVNTVRSYIRRHPPKDTVEVGCRQCGKPVMQHKGRKAKYFCSDRCRNAWWNAHPEKVQRKAYYRLACRFCGKEFVSYGNKNRKYCSRLCYADARRSRSVSDPLRSDG